MREFDLEAAKRGEPIVCRDGTPAKFIAHVPEAHPTNRLIVLVLGNIYGSYEDGKWGPTPEKYDLFMAPKKRTVWVNLYGGSSAMHFPDKDTADEHHRITTNGATIINRIGNRAYPVEIEE